MERIVAFVKKRPLGAAIIITVLGILVGTFFGWAFAYEAARDISEGVRRDRPSDPLDMLPFVVLGYLALGFIGGAIVGLFTASIVYFFNRKPRSLSS